MNILITGGAGYIGTELIFKLITESDVKEIVIYDNLSRGNFNFFLGKTKMDSKKLKFVKGDILDTRKLIKEVQKADIVFHLAAKVTTPFADHSPNEFDQVNNWGTSELLYLVEKSKVKKFIYASSISVYGSSVDESNISSPLNPKTFYGISKMHGEEHVKRLLESDIQTYLFRFGNVYGYSKSMRFDSVINKFIFEANFSNRLRIFGDGNQSRSFIHIDRLTSFLNLVIQTELKPGIYNLVESSFKINEIVEVLKLLYPDLETIYANQNISMRSLIVKQDERIPFVKSIQKNDLTNDLKEFKSKFSF